MCKNHINVAITISIVFFVLLFVIVISSFFTKDNIEKYTMVKATVACKYAEKIFEEPIQEVKVEEVNVAEAKEITTEKENSNQEKISEPKKVNQEVTQKDIQTANSADAVANNAQVTTRSERNTVPTEYKGLATIGKIEIPRTGLNMPILSQVTAKGMEVGPCLLYSTGELNQSGNSLIVGHNYNSIFSKNKNLQIGDKIYITTLNGKTVEYTVYDKFLENPEEVGYIKRDTNGKPEITLSTCTDDDNYRMIILAK